MNKPDRLPADFAHSAAYPVFACQPADDKALVLHLSPAEYLRASFMDQRLFSGRRYPGWELSGRELDAAFSASARPSPPLRWIFHIGHCGSTLLSRMLDLIPGVLGIREPLPLLDLAAYSLQPESGGTVAIDWQRRILRGLQRGFRDTTSILVKPTSVVCAISHLLLQATPGSKALLLWCDLETWLTTMLRDPGLRDNAMQNSGFRKQGWIQFGLPAVGSTSEALARDWLVEQLRWAALEANPEFAGRAAHLDFAQLLASPRNALAKVANHFDLVLPVDFDDKLVESALMTRYSKDPRQLYDSTRRDDELQQARDRHEKEIHDGLDWAREALHNIAITIPGVLQPGIRG